MIQSMTGFGRASASSPAKKITIEIKSLNSKQLDLAMRVPSYFRELEVTLRNDIASRLVRGKVDISVTVENVVAETSAVVNVEVLRQYKQQIENLSRELSLPEPADWHSLLLRLPDAWKTEISLCDEADIEAFRQACSGAIDALVDFRKREGARLFDFFTAKINNIATLLDQVDPFEAERVPKVRARLEEQLAKLESIEYDRGRLEQELIYYIEKLDVTEEKLRLRTHLNYFLELLGQTTESGQGKQLGFVAQEIGREINTLGSKANHAGMQNIVVRMKDELEQIKEQVLNIL